MSIVAEKETATASKKYKYKSALEQYKTRNRVSERTVKNCVHVACSPVYSHSQFLWALFASAPLIYIHL